MILNRPKGKLIDRTNVDDPNIRWKWMAGAAFVAGASAAATSQAGVVQILLSNNQISSGGANDLKTDITGDNMPDLLSFRYYTQSVQNSGFYYSGKFYYRTALHTVSVNDSQGNFFGGAFYAKTYESNSARNSRLYTRTEFQAQAGGLNSSGSVTSFGEGTTPQSVRGLTPVSFTDSRINGGLKTNGFVDTRAFNTTTTSHTVQLVKLVFNDSSTSLPEGLVPGDDYPDFDPDNVVTNPVVPTVDPTVAAQRTKLSSDVKKLKKKAKKLKKKGKKAKAKKLKKKIKKLKSSLAALG